MLEQIVTAETEPMSATPELSFCSRCRAWLPFDPVEPHCPQCTIQVRRERRGASGIPERDEAPRAQPLPYLDDRDVDRDLDLFESLEMCADDDLNFLIEASEDE